MAFEVCILLPEVYQPPPPPPEPPPPELDPGAVVEDNILFVYPLHLSTGFLAACVSLSLLTGVL